ncbi:MAG TPA: hypothetical protein ENH96_01275 [Chlamydiae bacterium]|nr:hypothetical protein [Candidatus Anoxychlamydiales bacterium]HEU64005.1 hypothetical protein [Chlamydiota bacterium]
MHEHVKKIVKVLEIELPKQEKDKSYIIEITKELEVKIFDLDPGFYFLANIASCPNEKKEDLFIYLMRANLLGQGTGRCRIGMDMKEKFLTLSYLIDYEVNYIVFKEKFEDFVNYINFWKKEILLHKEKAESSIL